LDRRLSAGQFSLSLSKGGDDEFIQRAFKAVDLKRLI
jgi:hypothetical protein